MTTFSSPLKCCPKTEIVSFFSITRFEKLPSQIGTFFCQHKKITLIETDPLHETTEKSPVKIESFEKPPMTSFHEIFGSFVKTEKLTETSTVAAESPDNTETISVDLGKFVFYV